MLHAALQTQISTDPVKTLLAALAEQYAGVEDHAKTCKKCKAPGRRFGDFVDMMEDQNIASALAVFTLYARQVAHEWAKFPKETRLPILFGLLYNAQTIAQLEISLGHARHVTPMGRDALTTLTQILSPFSDLLAADQAKAAGKIS